MLLTILPTRSSDPTTDDLRVHGCLEQAADYLST